MRLFTFQDKYVLDLLEYKEKNGLRPIYECTDIFFQHREQDLYNKFINKMKIALKIPYDRVVIPIWCWVVPKDQELTDEYIDELYTRYVPKCNNMVGIELNVPKEFVFLSNFQVWQDLLFRVTFKQEITDSMIDKLFEKQKGAILQAAIPILDKQFIINTKIYNDHTKKDYSETDAEVAELQSRGEFLDG